MGTEIFRPWWRVQNTAVSASSLRSKYSFVKHDLRPMIGFIQTEFVEYGLLEYKHAESARAVSENMFVFQLKICTQKRLRVHRDDLHPFPSFSKLPTGLIALISDLQISHCVIVYRSIHYLVKRPLWFRVNQEAGCWHHYTKGKEKKIIMTYDGYFLKSAKEWGWTRVGGTTQRQIRNSIAHQLCKPCQSYIIIHATST